MTEHPIDELGAFALGDLDPQRASAVVEHADRCDDCALALAQALAGVAALELADAAAPQAGADRDRFKLVPWLGAALATAAALALFAWNVQLRAGSVQVPEANVVPITALVHSHFVHHALTGPGGNAKVIQAIDGSWVYVVADGLAAGKGYQLFVNGTPLGSIVADPSGRAASFWQRRPSKISSLGLSGPGNALMRWSEIARER